jgi:hypothetical protein
MKTFLCLILVIFSFVSHMLIFPRLGVSYMQHPIPNYIGMLIGIGLLVWLMTKKFTILRLVATLFSVFVLGAFFWYTVIFSSYDNTKAAIATGDTASQSLKQIAMASIEGEQIQVGEILKKNKGTLFVFTRGAW